jgi:hypothetical protein
MVGSGLGFSEVSRKYEVVKMWDEGRANGCRDSLPYIDRPLLQEWAVSCFLRVASPLSRAQLTGW